jgi:hypothetical protein
MFPACHITGTWPLRECFMAEQAADVLADDAAGKREECITCIPCGPQLQGRIEIVDAPARTAFLPTRTALPLTSPHLEKVHPHTPIPATLNS